MSQSPETPNPTRQLVQVLGRSEVLRLMAQDAEQMARRISYDPRLSSNLRDQAVVLTKAAESLAALTQGA